MGSLLKQNPFHALPEEKVVVLIKSILSALKELHDRGVAHRDLKPSNIMVNEDLNVKLIDLGCAFIKKSKNNSITFGTKGFLAPELRVSKKSASDPWKLDIWAVGVITHQLYFGVLPDLEDSDLNPGQDESRNKNHIFIPPDMSHFLKIAMEVRPDMRADINQLLSHRWLKKAHQKL